MQKGVPAADCAELPHPLLVPRQASRKIPSQLRQPRSVEVPHGLFRVLLSVPLVLQGCLEVNRDGGLPRAGCIARSPQLAKFGGPAFIVILCRRRRRETGFHGELVIGSRVTVNGVSCKRPQSRGVFGKGIRL